MHDSYLHWAVRCVHVEDLAGLGRSCTWPDAAGATSRNAVNHFILVSVYRHTTRADDEPGAR